MALTDTTLELDALERAVTGDTVTGDTVAPSRQRTPVAPVAETAPAPGRLAPAGRLDVATALDLRAAAVRAIARRPGTLIVDLGAVTHLDAAGLAAVSHAALAARRAGIVCRVLAPRATDPGRVLQMTGMDRLLLDGANTPTGR